MYNYNAKVERVVDGDTIVLNIDLGFTVHWRSSCRLWGINSPELNSKDKDERIRALEAKQYLIDRLKVGSNIIINSRKLDKYGRPIVQIIIDGIDLNNEIVEKGLAVRYMEV